MTHRFIGSASDLLGKGGALFCRICRKPALPFFVAVILPSALFGQVEGSCSPDIPLADLVNVIGLAAVVLSIAWLGRITLRLMS